MQTLFSYSEIEKMPKIKRLNLINTITGFKSANLIGTIDQRGITNLAIFSSVIHLGSNPPLIGFITRPTDVPRHTYLNIQENGFFTINQVNQHFLEQAHQTSAKYEPQVSEFDSCNLTIEHISSFPAPFVKESQIKIGLQRIEEHPVKANGTILVIRKVQLIALPEQVLEEDGFVDLTALDTVTISGLDTYLLPQKIARFSYARPNQELKRLDF